MSQSKSLSRQHAVLDGKYRLGSIIGSGGVATVYRARHLWTEREVAVKVLNPNLPHIDRLRECFLREARATVQLDHPNVVDVLDMGDDDHDVAYMVMELLHGPTLRDVLLEHGTLGEEDTLAILLPLINALEKSHELGIVHRDFKPENIMLTLDPQGAVIPKLLDFGVAEILQDVRSRHLRSAGDVIMGTPQYMSPEQARDQRALIGPHTDIWGIGVVWYECVTGAAPFDGESAIEILEAVCEAEVDFDPVPDAFVSILREMLTRSIDQRADSLTTIKTRIEDMGISIPPAPASDSALSSWPSPPVDEQHFQQTLTGVGPEGVPWSAPIQSRVDSELLHIPVKSNRRSAIAGLGLTLAVAVAAWWTVREPNSSRPYESIVETAPASPRTAYTTPAPADEDLLGEAPEPVAEAEAPEPAAEVEAPELVAEVQAPEPAAEVERRDAAPPSPSTPVEAEPEAKTPAPRRAKQRSVAPRRRAPTPPRSKRNRYQEAPALVTEW